MTPTDYARIVHSITLLAMSEGHDGSALLKGALAAVTLAGDPSSRIKRVDVKLTLEAKAGEIHFDEAVSLDAKAREEIRGPG